MSSSSLLRCWGSAASSRLEALAGGSGAGASLREAGLAASLAPLLFLGSCGFSGSSSLEELSSLLLPEPLLLLESLSEDESLLSESPDDESLSEEESESPAQQGMGVNKGTHCCTHPHACLWQVQEKKSCFAGRANGFSRSISCTPSSWTNLVR